MVGFGETNSPPTEMEIIENTSTEHSPTGHPTPKERDFAVLVPEEYYAKIFQKDYTFLKEKVAEETGCREGMQEAIIIIFLSDKKQTIFRGDNCLIIFTRK